MTVELVDLPTGADVAAFLDRAGNAATTAHAGEVVKHITAYVRAYTRGRGFAGIGAEAACAPELAAAIITMTGRAIANPAGHKAQSVDGVGSVTFGEFKGPNLIELAVLNRYRRRVIG